MKSLYLIEDGNPRRRTFETLAEAVNFCKGQDVGQPEIDTAVFREDYDDGGNFIREECVFSIFRELPQYWDYDKDDWC